MRAVVQRVAWAEVEVAGQVLGRIEKGLLVYAGVGAGDGPEQARWLAEKLAGLRVFEDGQGKLNRSVGDVDGAVLVISNFTVLADARHGRRPEFFAAAGRQAAEPVHEAFLQALRDCGVTVATGRFAARMAIRCQADGPVNVIVDSPPPAQ